MTVRYSTGQHRLVTSDRCVALLPGDLDDALLADIWTEVSAATDLLRVIEVLLSRGLGTVPSMAMAMRSENRVQVILRGNGRAFGGGAWHDSGSRATWSEIDLPGPRVILTLDDSDEPMPGIPLLGGVVLAGSVALDLESESGGMPTSRPSQLASNVPVGVDLANEASSAEAARQPWGVPPIPAVPTAGQPVADVAAEVTRDPGTGINEKLDPPAALDEPPTVPPQPEHEIIELVQAESTPQAEPTPQDEVQAGAASESQADVEPDSEEDSYDRLFELTFHGASPDAVPADAPVTDPRPAVPTAAEPGDGAEELTSGPSGDHHQPLVDALADDDDMPELTVVRPPDPPAGIAAPSAPRGPLVSALRCPRGHLNPPGTAVCRVCASGIGPQTPSQVPRPTLGVLLATETVPGAPRRIPLDSDLLIGRRPGHGPVPDQGVRLVTIPSPERDISRRHLRVSLDGWAVLITDLGSTNGTTVSLPGRTAREVRSGEVVPIVAGTRLTLADVATYVFEVE